MSCLPRNPSLPDKWSVFVEALQAGRRILVACRTRCSPEAVLGGHAEDMCPFIWVQHLT